jgi:cysteine desulfurase
MASAIEHDSVRLAHSNLKEIPVTRDGIVDLDQFEQGLKQHKPALVSVMLANNETGIIQPVSRIAALAKSYGAFVHCDAVQAAGRIDISLQDLGVDFLSLSSHKLGGPQGAGALILGVCGITPVLLQGGGQEKKARAGTENIAGIVGFGLAAEVAQRELEIFRQQQLSFQNKLVQGVTQRDPDSSIFGQSVPRLVNTSLIRVRGFSSESLLMHFDLSGIAISNGAACSSGAVKPSHVLAAMGYDPQGHGTIRVSTGWATQTHDIDIFLEAYAKILSRRA